MVCVRPGVLLVRASARRATRALMALDLPTLERPAKAISKAPSEGRSASRATARRKAADARGVMAKAGNSNKIAPFGSGGQGMVRVAAMALALLAASSAIAQDKAQSIAAQVCAACHAADG